MSAPKPASPFARIDKLLADARDAREERGGKLPERPVDYDSLGNPREHVEHPPQSWRNP